MKRFAEQLKNKADAIRLSTQERTELRDRLKAYTEYHPIKSEASRSGVKYVPSFSHLWVWSRLPNFSSAVRFTGAFAVFFLTVIPVLAERALPGEILYPVKVRFNEELRGALVSSPYQKIEWETERLERRLAEARLLADSGRLTAAAEADVAKAIRLHSAAAKQSIATIRESDTDEALIAEITLASALEVQSEMIGRQEQVTGSVPATALVNAVNEAKLSVTARSNEAASYAKLLGRLETETTRAYEYFNSLDKVTSREEKSEVERRLNDVRVKVEAAAAIREEDELTASRQLAEALGSTRKIISFMTNLDVRKSVKIEDLVPITLTEQERRSALDKKLEEMETVITQVASGTSKLATTSSDYIDIADGLEHYKELHFSASSALASGDLVAAEAAISSALDLAKGLLYSLRVIGVVTEATSTPATSSPARR